MPTPKNDEQPPTVAIDPEAVGRALAAMPPDELFALMLQTLDTLSETARARMLYALVQQPMSVRDLALVAGVSESSASHQLRLLRKRGMVAKEGHGNVRLYSLTDHHIAGIFRELEYHADHHQQKRPDHG